MELRNCPVKAKINEKDKFSTANKTTAKAFENKENLIESFESDGHDDDDNDNNNDNNTNPSEKNSAIYMELYKQFTQIDTPTAADLKRKLTDDQLKELCMRKKCKVLMNRWNLVHDYEQSFQRQGRLENKRRCDITKLVRKAVKRHIEIGKPYTDEQIQKQRAKEWAFRKKDHILSLELWEYDRQNHEKTNNSTQNSTVIEMVSEKQNNEEQNDSSAISILDSVEFISNELQLPYEIVNSESETLINPLVILEKQEKQQQQEKEQKKQQNQQKQKQKLNECTPISCDGLIEDLLNVNTESMSINVETLSAINSENNNEPPLISTETIANSYNEFNEQILSTSTQSQSDQNKFKICTQSSLSEDIVID